MINKALHSLTSTYHFIIITSISALLTMPKPLTVWTTINYRKFFKRWEYQTARVQPQRILGYPQEGRHQQEREMTRVL